MFIILYDYYFFFFSFLQRFVLFTCAQTYDMWLYTNVYGRYEIRYLYRHIIVQVNGMETNFGYYKILWQLSLSLSFVSFGTPKYVCLSFETRATRDREREEKKKKISEDGMNMAYIWLMFFGIADCISCLIVWSRSYTHSKVTNGNEFEKSHSHTHTHYVHPHYFFFSSFPRNQQLSELNRLKYIRK